VKYLLGKSASFKPRFCDCINSVLHYFVPKFSLNSFIFSKYCILSGMEDPVNMQDDVQRKPSWKAQLVSYKNSWVIFAIACYFFLLRLLKEFFKSGEMTVEKEPISVRGAVNLRSASEIQVEDIQEQPEHAVNISVVDLHSSPALPSAPSPLEKPEVIPLEPTSEHSKNTLVIKNLPFKFKLGDLEKLLSEFPAKIKNVRLLRDESGKFTGMAFLRCATKEDAQTLISQMSNLDISGRAIQVEFKTKGKKKKNLNGSSDSMSSSSSDWEERPAAKIEELKPFRRKSTSDSFYLHSAVSRIHAEKSLIRPTRQPVGPDGKTNGFSAEYRKSRSVKN